MFRPLYYISKRYICKASLWISEALFFSGIFADIFFFHSSFSVDFFRLLGE